MCTPVSMRDRTSGLHGLSHPLYLFLALPAYHAWGAAASPVPTAPLLMACIGCRGQTGGKHSQSIPLFLLHSHSTLFYSIFKYSSYLTSSILELTFAQNHLLLHAGACIGKGCGYTALKRVRHLHA